MFSFLNNCLVALNSKNNETKMNTDFLKRNLNLIEF